MKKNKVCLITGATSGIGKETAVALAKIGSTIIVNGKDEKRGEETITEIKRVSGNENVELMIADLSSLNEVRKFAGRLKGKYDKLDILINNAAVFCTSRNLSLDGIEMQFAVNHLSNFLLTNLLLETLKKSNSARIINVSSNAHYQGRINFDDINFEKRYFGWTVYCQSKLANVLFTYELADRLDPKQVTVNALHPGTVRTNIVGKYASFIYRLGWNLQKPLMLPVEEGAKTSIYLASSEEVKGITGLYFVKCKSQKSSDMSYDKMLARKLWDLSEKLTGFQFSENQ